MSCGRHSRVIRSRIVKKHRTRPLKLSTGGILRTNQKRGETEGIASTKTFAAGRSRGLQPYLAAWLLHRWIHPSGKHLRCVPLMGSLNPNIPHYPSWSFVPSPLISLRLHLTLRSISSMTQLTLPAFWICLASYSWYEAPFRPDWYAMEQYVWKSLGRADLCDEDEDEEGDE